MGLTLVVPPKILRGSHDHMIDQFGIENGQKLDQKQYYFPIILYWIIQNAMLMMDNKKKRCEKIFLFWVYISNIFKPTLNIQSGSPNYNVYTKI